MYKNQTFSKQIYQFLIHTTRKVKFSVSCKTQKNFYSNTWLHFGALFVGQNILATLEQLMVNMTAKHDNFHTTFQMPVTKRALLASLRLVRSEAFKPCDSFGSQDFFLDLNFFVCLYWTLTFLVYPHLTIYFYKSSLRTQSHSWYDL